MVQERSEWARKKSHLVESSWGRLAGESGPETVLRGEEELRVSREERM